MGGCRRRISPTCAGRFLSAALLLATFSMGAKAECSGENGGASVVTEISDGETLILGDGRTVRLANVFTPKRSRGSQPTEARAEMEKALAAMVLNKRIELRLSDTKRDRYGRILAHVMVIGDDGAVWVQDRLVASGLVRVMVAGEGSNCLADLVRHENEAREAKQGLWKNGYFAVRPAAADDILTGLAHSYELVEGTVTNVTTVRGRTYVNFGADWHRDFTIVLPEKSLQQMTSRTPGFDAAKLKGQVVRVRGWIETFNGPSITVNHTEQLEVTVTAPPSQ